jgi:hypothetical protein
MAVVLGAAFGGERKTPGIYRGFRMEALSGFEPEYTDLQSAA